MLASDCRTAAASPVALAKTEPRMVLPPLRGMMFMTSPAVSVSPSAVAVRNVTSSDVPSVDDVARRRVAAGRAADVQAVEREPALVGPAAMNRKRRGRRAGDDIVAGGGDAGHEHEQRVVAASSWNRSDDVTAERELAAQAVGVDDGKLAGDGDGFRRRSRP